MISYKKTDVSFLKHALESVACRKIKGSHKAEITKLSCSFSSMGSLFVLGGDPHHKCFKISVIRAAVNCDKLRSKHFSSSLMHVHVISRRETQCRGMKNKPTVFTRI